jgi:chromobox protein 5
MEPKASKRARKSAGVDDESDTTSVAKKRGRKSTTRIESDEEDEEPAKNKKVRRGTIQGKTPDEPQRLHDMSKYMDKDSWEDLVDTVDTVERSEEGLVVYFTLYVLKGCHSLKFKSFSHRPDYRKNGETIRERGDLCRPRFPQKVRV